MGRYKVRSWMRKAVLKPVWKRKFVHTTDSKHDLPIAASKGGGSPISVSYCARSKLSRH